MAELLNSLRGSLNNSVFAAGFYHLAQYLLRKKSSRHCHFFIVQPFFIRHFKHRG